jgi:hypothetical protein
MATPPRVPITHDDVLPLIGNRKLLDPPTTRLTWTNSRLVLLDNGVTMPLLHIIAEHNFGPWDPYEFYPVWCDRDWTNESLDNVRLIRKPNPRSKRQVNKSGFPAGTPGYFKWYRQQHPDKVKQWARDAYERKREQQKQDVEMRAELERLRAHVHPVEELTAPSLDFLEQYKANVGGGSSPLVQSPIQIGTPMEDDEPYNFKPSSE